MKNSKFDSFIRNVAKLNYNRNTKWDAIFEHIVLKCFKTLAVV